MFGIQVIFTIFWNWCALSASALYSQRNCKQAERFAIKQYFFLLSLPLCFHVTLPFSSIKLCSMYRSVGGNACSTFLMYRPGMVLRKYIWIGKRHEKYKKHKHNTSNQWISRWKMCRAIFVLCKQNMESRKRNPPRNCSTLIHKENSRIFFMNRKMAFVNVVRVLLLDISTVTSMPDK